MNARELFRRAWLRARSPALQLIDDAADIPEHFVEAAREALYEREIPPTIDQRALTERALLRIRQRREAP